MSEAPAMARQLCPGANRQLMEDATDTVECPACLLKFSTFSTCRNGAQQCPIVPSHISDSSGAVKVALAKTKRRSGTPRPW